MKKVVLSEGKNDVYFLSEVHDRSNSGDEYSVYISEVEEEDQTKRLRQYRIDSRFNFYYKSEGGRSKVIKKLRSHSLMFTEFQLYLLVDLDCSTINDFLELANGKLKEDYGNKVKITQDGQKRFNDIVIIDSTLQMQTIGNRSIPIVAFYDDLEAAVGINSSDNKEKKLQKIRSYLNDNPKLEEEISNIIIN